jgi:hypothetical protein
MSKNFELCDDDVYIVRCALSVYENNVHPDNSIHKDIIRLIDVFNKE